MNIKQLKYTINYFIKVILYITGILITMIILLLLLNQFHRYQLPISDIFIKHPYLYIPAIFFIILIPFAIIYTIKQRSKFKQLLKNIKDLNYKIEEMNQSVFRVVFDHRCYLEISQGNPVQLHLHRVTMNDARLTRKVSYAVEYQILGIERDVNWYEIFKQIYNIVPKNLSQKDFDLVILMFRYIGKIFEHFQSINHNVQITMENFFIHARSPEIDSYLQKIEKLITHLEEHNYLLKS